VDATRVNNGASGAAVAMSYGGDGKELLAARAAAWRARGRPAGGAKAVGELGGDAWSGAGAVVGLGQRGNSSGWWRYRAAEEAEEEEEWGGGVGHQGLICCFQNSRDLTVNQNFPLI
jgi:hypothetical protein